MGFSYGSHQVLDEVGFKVNPGEMLAILGPNGCGKTTLLKIVSGVLHPAKGSVSIQGADLRQTSRRRIAQTVAVVPQELYMPFSFTVAEMVMLGRTPFIRPLRGETVEDQRVVEWAMKLTDISGLAERSFLELSGGEKQRVILAMALAQEPKVLLLDEPTVHLDIWHQMEMLDLVRQLNAQIGVTVVAVLHDLNFASIYFPRLLFLSDGKVVADGAPADVVRSSNIRSVFHADVEIQMHPVLNVPQVVVVPNGRELGEIVRERMQPGA
ncbi:MAG: heme ABC transporter ATP-binding protein [Chloroflexi bacterium]|nr:heme ABC transporter ATP-binding protein [Chloroflexota bacterium]